MFVMFVMFVVSFMTEILNILDLALYHQVIPDGWKIVKINFSHQLSTFEVLNEKSKKKCRNQYNDTQTNISPHLDCDKKSLFTTHCRLTLISNY